MQNVFFLGLVSFFTDISTEMVYPVIPLYLTGAFGATPALVGVIEGLAESLASLLKVFSGYVTDRFRHHKLVAFCGYATGIVYRFSLLLASSWVGVLAARVIDRVGKGIRTAPRDVMVSESAGASRMGGAFGFHKAMDMAGSAAGILITYFLLLGGWGGGAYKRLFLVSLIPAALGLAMFLFIRRGKTAAPAAPAKREPFWKNARKISGQLKLYLLVVFLFTLGNSSNSFLLLKAKATGFDDAAVILLYFASNLSASLLSLPFGRLSDKVGRKKLLVGGYMLFSLVYFGYAAAFDRAFLAVMFVLYGAYTAMVAGVERAYVAEIAPPELKGTMLGLQSTVAGVALLPASVIAGALWNAFGSAVPFVFGACMALAAALLLLFFMKDPAKNAAEAPV